jgi:hypothetical protein
VDDRHTHTFNSPASTAFIVVASTLGGMLIDLLSWLDATTHGLTGPQATLLIGFAGLALQCARMLLRWAGRKRRVRRRRALGLSDFTQEPHR